MTAPDRKPGADLADAFMDVIEAIVAAARQRRYEDAAKLKRDAAALLAAFVGARL